METGCGSPKDPSPSPSTFLRPYWEAEFKSQAQDKQTVEVVSMSRSQGNYEEEQGRCPPVQKAALFMAGYVTRCVFLTRHGFTGVEHPGNELLPPSPSAASIRVAR
ncbi:hypothetical protein KOW79_010769 [Hemibagrus wyckioides]|uniref:Uncharacterized protein n=1 Tax=Hemibagrus wyckioides TaxID=337641 RepID=A0A9D3NPL8_9TELE|nr:hypothetical protein KOW79_010769 [Hemibagrus wyckioides]